MFHVFTFQKWYDSDLIIKQACAIISIIGNRRLDGILNSYENIWPSQSVF